MGVQIVTHFNAIGKAGNEQVQSTSICGEGGTTDL
jgi:hypothetical protein